MATQLATNPLGAMTKADGEPTDIASSLAGFVRTQLDEMSRFREQIQFTARLGECLRMREGLYDLDTLKKISALKGSTVYARLGTNKIRGAAAMLRAIFIQNERPWDINPTPVPTLPEDITAAVDMMATQEAQNMAEAGQPVTEAALQQRKQALLQAAQDAARKKSRDEAARSTEYMDDILTEGDFYKALNEFLLDFSTLPVAVLRGPTAAMKNKVKYVNGVPTKTRIAMLGYARVDPYDFMWTPNAGNVEEADIIERIRMTRSSLQALIGLDGYNSDAIKLAMEEYGRSGHSEYDYFDTTRDKMQNRESQLFSTEIDVLAYSGYVPGEFLEEHDVAIDDPELDYMAQVWVCGRHVLKAQLEPDPMERHSYYTASYEPVPGSIVGTALPELLLDVQESYNSTWRSLQNNVGIASGPQVAINIDRVPDDADVTTMFPWKIWEFDRDPSGNSAEKAIEFFQPTLNAQELIGVLSFLQTLADEVSSIPRYMTGNSQMGGAGRTASGLSMLMGNAQRTMTSVAGTIDENVLAPLLRKTYDLVLLTTGNKVLRGDESIVVRGATFAEKRETDRMRELEFMQYTNNPTDLAIIGPTGRANMLRNIAGTFMGGDDIVPSKSEIEAQLRAQQAAAQAQAAQQAIQGAANPEQEQEQGQAPGQKSNGGSPTKPNAPKGQSQQLAEGTDNMHRTNAPVGHA